VSDALPPLTLEQAYSGVDYGKKGVDFTVALPRFRLPGKIDELANKVISKVSLKIPRHLCSNAELQILCIPSRITLFYPR
jgi:hypothetical protein